MPEVTAVVTASFWNSPIVLAGLVAAVLALITWMQNKSMTNTQGKLVAASELRAADIRKKEKEEDYARQDAVAEKAEIAAKLLLESQTAAIKRQNEVAEQVAITAKQAAAAAELLVISQKATNTRQDEVAGLVAEAAKQAKDAAALLVDAQDKATKQVAAAADLLVHAQEETIKRTDEVARVAAENDKRVQEQLIAIDEQGKKIHILVNSDMTAARTAERDSLKLLVISLKNALALSMKLGVKLSGTEQEEIEKIEKRISELDQILADRHAAQVIVEAEAKASGTPAAPTAQVGTPLEKDRNSRPTSEIENRRQSDPATDAALKEIVKNTGDTARNTTPDKKK